MFVQEQHQLAGLDEVGLRGEQGDAGEPVVVLARHGGRGDGQDRAAQTVAAGMDLRAGHDLRHRVQRRHHALTPIVVEADVAVAPIGVLP